MAAPERKIILNRGNIVNRIGQARRHTACAYIIAVVAIGFAALGWSRALSPITDYQIIKHFQSIGKLHLQTDCEEYAETMCNN